MSGRIHHPRLASMEIRFLLETLALNDDLRRSLDAAAQDGSLSSDDAEALRERCLEYLDHHGYDDRGSPQAPGAPQIEAIVDVLYEISEHDDG